MKQIYFRSEKELIYFCELIFEKVHSISIEWKQSKNFGNELTLFGDNLDKDMMVACLRELFIDMQLEDMLKEVVETRYFFTDDAEINQIVSFSKSIAVGSNFENEFIDLITHLFRRYVWSAEAVHYDAMITFSNKALMNSLDEIAGQGIDEFKLEEKHQHFLLSARCFLENRTPLTDTVHILQGEGLCLYKKNGKKFSTLELRTAMINAPLYLIGLDENEWDLSPVIALHPERICIYGTNPAEATTVSLMSIFEEHAMFFPIDEFPFSG